MAYVTVDDYKVLGLPSDALEDLSDPDIQQFLDVAAGVIDSYLSRYSLPLIAPYPEALKGTNVCLATWKILLHRGYNPETYDNNYREAYDRCMAFLEKVGSGEVTLPGVEDQTPGFEGGVPRVTTKPLRGWGSNDGVW